MDILVVRGDITQQDVDAIVTAANRHLGGGSGVHGAVHAAAGPELLAASLALAPCAPGSAVVTPAFALAPVRWVIHAVGPRYTAHPDDAALLTSTYRAALTRADEVGARIVAFPSISTGRYGFPKPQAAALSVAALRSAATSVRTVFLVTKHDDVADLWVNELGRR